MRGTPRTSEIPAPIRTLLTSRVVSHVMMFAAKHVTATAEMIRLRIHWSLTTRECGGTYSTRPIGGVTNVGSIAGSSPPPSPPWSTKCLATLRRRRERADLLPPLRWPVRFPRHRRRPVQRARRIHPPHDCGDPGGDLLQHVPDGHGELDHLDEGLRDRRRGSDRLVRIVDHPERDRRRDRDVVDLDHAAAHLDDRTGDDRHALPPVSVSWRDVDQGDLHQLQPEVAVSWWPGVI